MGYMPFFLSDHRTTSVPLSIAATRHMRGFTLLEVMVVVAIIAVLAALAGPSFTPLIKRGGGINIDATGGWDHGWKVTHTQGSATIDLQISPAPSKIAMIQSNNKDKLYVDRWGMLSEISGGTPTAMSILLYPAGKSTTDSSAIRLCITSGGRIMQMKQGAACT